MLYFINIAMCFDWVDFLQWLITMATCICKFPNISSVLEINEIGGGEAEGKQGYETGNFEYGNCLKSFFES